MNKSNQKKTGNILCFVFLLIYLFTNCENTKDKETLAPLPKDKMKVVLTDLYLAEAAAELHRVSNDSALLPHKSYYFEDIFKKHNLTPQQYEKAYEYYTGQPDALLEIYEDIKEDLNALDESFKKNKPEFEK